METETIYECIKLYEKGKITVKEISETMKISERQVYRILCRYKQSGIQGLYHGNKNKPSHNRIDNSKKEQIISLIRDKYYDCGASYTSELLEEYEGIKINRETLRLAI